MERLGVEASLLGYGCMRLPVGPDGKIDEEKATALIEKGLENGINYIDTAYPYHNGESESFVGKVLKNHPRDSFYLATKMPSWEIHKVEDVDRIFAIQLDRLQTNYVDFYLIHAIGRDKWRELVQLGVVEHLECKKTVRSITSVSLSMTATKRLKRSLTIETGISARSS